MERGYGYICETDDYWIWLLGIVKRIPYPKYKTPIHISQVIMNVFVIQRMNIFYHPIPKRRKNKEIVSPAR